MVSGASIDVDYFVEYNGSATRYVAYPVSKVVDNVTYTLPLDAIGWRSYAYLGNNQFSTGADGFCVYIKFDGDVYKEYGTYSLPDYTGQVTCPTTPEVDNWDNTCTLGVNFQYTCMASRQSTTGSTGTSGTTEANPFAATGTTVHHATGTTEHDHFSTAGTTDRDTGAATGTTDHRPSATSGTTEHNPFASTGNTGTTEHGPFRTTSAVTGHGATSDALSGTTDADHAATGTTMSRTTTGLVSSTTGEEPVEIVTRVYSDSACGSSQVTGTVTNRVTPNKCSVFGPLVAGSEQSVLATFSGYGADDTVTMRIFELANCNGSMTLRTMSNGACQSVDLDLTDDEAVLAKREAGAVGGTVIYFAVEWGARLVSTSSASSGSTSSGSTSSGSTSSGSTSTGATSTGMAPPPGPTTNQVAPSSTSSGVVSGGVSGGVSGLVTTAATTRAPDNQNNSDNDDSKRNRAGMIAGIVIACIVVLAVAIILAVFLIRRRRRNEEEAGTELGLGGAIRLVKATTTRTVVDWGELAFNAGDIIEVVSDAGEWIHGRLNGNMGVLPRSAVEPYNGPKPNGTTANPLYVDDNAL